MGQGMGPQSFRVEPGPTLVSRHGCQTQERSEADRDDPDGTRTPPRDHPPEPAKTGGRQHDRAQHGHVAIAIGGNLVGEPNDARVGCQDNQVTQPGRQQSGPAPAQEKQAALMASVARMLKLYGNASQFSLLGNGQKTMRSSGNTVFRM